jgi:L-arabinose isomerase
LGAAIILAICDFGDRFRLVRNEVDVVAPDEPLPKLPVAWAVSEPKPDRATSTESWIAAGGPHRTWSTLPTCSAWSC